MKGRESHMLVLSSRGALVWASSPRLDAHGVHARRSWSEARSATIDALKRRRPVWVVVALLSSLVEGGDEATTGQIGCRFGGEGARRVLEASGPAKPPPVECTWEQRRWTFGPQPAWRGKKCTNAIGERQNGQRRDQGRRDRGELQRRGSRPRCGGQRGHGRHERRARRHEHRGGCAHFCLQSQLVTLVHSRNAGDSYSGYR